MGNLKSSSTSGSNWLFEENRGCYSSESVAIEFLELENINIGNIIKFHRWKKMSNLKVPVLPVRTEFSRSTGGGIILKVSLLNSSTSKT